MEEAEFDKTEQATPLKLKRAREKGAIARSLDLGFFAAIVTTIGFLWIAGADMAVAIARASGEAFATAGSLGSHPQVLAAAVARLGSSAVMPLLTFVGLLFGIALALDFLQVGLVFSAAPLKPDFNRINPAQGFKRLFSKRMLIEAAKATLKLAVYAAIAWLTIGGLLEQKAELLGDGSRIASVLASGVLRLLLFFALAAFFFAMMDQLLVRRDFAKRMRMSRRELKREHRDREGEPHQKQRRKQLHRELSKVVRALRDVRGSDAIITNPVHYAVALRYDPASMDAPAITARGAGEVAQRIKRLGFVYGVPTISDPTLARALFRHGRIGAEIPSNLYQAVADHYRRNGLGK